MSRELKRNMMCKTAFTNLPQPTVWRWRANAEATKVERLSQLKTYILDRLARKLTPEQISGRLTP